MNSPPYWIRTVTGHALRTSTLSGYAMLRRVVQLSVCAMSACVEPKPEAANVEAQRVSPVADKWLGTWAGPEGTALVIAGGNGEYVVTIRNLDGPRTFRGRAADSQLAFVRDGVRETLHATDGVGTGMKWLSERTNCLTIRVGEGYCRELRPNDQP